MTAAMASGAPQVPRQGRVERKTKETQIVLQVGLDGTGASKVETGIPFFSHMLEAWAKHGLMDLTVDAHGDLEVESTLGEGACFTVSLPRGADEVLDARLTGERPARQQRADLSDQSN